MLWTLLIVVVILVIGGMLFINFYPSFGGDVTKERQTKYVASKQFKEGLFTNTKDVPKNLGFFETLGLAYTFFTTKVPNARPKDNLQVVKRDSAEVSGYSGATRLIWYGHSAFLLQMEGKNILLDPMFGKVAAPHPWLGSNRYNKEMPLEVEKMPKIDAVIISHDHYDHLDYESIQKLKTKVDHYFVPLGVGVHLEAWGVPKEAITEMDWWQEIGFEGLLLACTPAQHFSGRKINDRQSTLWSSWVIKSDKENIYFSGDGGYGPHFKEIGAKYGPFDFAMMECGQYNEQWADIHMMPEETAQAGVDIQAMTIMPIHWGGFTLALHSWTDPIERVTAKAHELNLPLVAPRIGEYIVLNGEKPQVNKWWQLE